MSAFRKTTETFTAGARTLSQRYFIGREIFAGTGKDFWPAMGVGWTPKRDRGGGRFPGRDRGWREPDRAARSAPDSARVLNVCRHRGTRLCEAPTGRLRAIQCPYHAWTYALDGRLTGAPHMDEAPDFEKSDYSLHAVHLVLWEGFIFVNLAANPVPAAEWFAPLTSKFAHWNLPQLRSARRMEYDVRANWKLIFQNYSECYHCPGVHPALAKISPYRFGRKRSRGRTLSRRIHGDFQGRQPNDERKSLRAAAG